MYHVTKEIDFCYGHRLLDYEGPCQHLHGHNGRAEIELASEALDDRDMVFEFGDLKQRVKGWIDEQLDHKMILRQDDPLVAILRDIGEPIYLMERNPTAEAIAEEIFRYASSAGLPVISVKLWETPSASAVYR